MTSDLNSDLRPVRRCRACGPGHNVHHIQAVKLAEFLDRHPERCVTVHLTEDGDGWFTMYRDGETARGWSHDAHRVRTFVLDSLLDTVQLIPFSGVLISAHHDRTGGRNGYTVLYPAWRGLDTPRGVRNDEIGRCRYPDAPR